MLRKLFLAVALVASLAAHSWAVKAVIVGDAQVEPGDLALLDGGTSEGCLQYRWLLVNSKKRFIVSESGSKVYFSSNLPGEYRFLLVGAGVTADNKLDIATAEHVLIVGQPIPTPPGPNPPGPNPPPVPVVGSYSVAIVYETSELRTLAQNKKGEFSALYSSKAADILSAKCAKDASGKPLWRRYDKDQPLEDASPFKPLLLAASKTELPAIVIADAAGVKYVAPLPAGEDAVIELLTKWLGK